MANTYKLNANELNASGSTTIYTAPLGTTTLVKSLYIANVSSSGVTIDVILSKSGSATNYYLISGATVPYQSSFQPISDTIVLQTGDSLKISTPFQSGSDTLLSYMEIT
jgi:hypothetical protein